MQTIVFNDDVIFLIAVANIIEDGIQSILVEYQGYFEPSSIERSKTTRCLSKLQ